jgi:L-asparaginase
MLQHLTIITTGGTIDKVYFDDKSTFQIGAPRIGEILGALGVAFEFDVVALMRRDSLHMSAEDRDLIRRTIAAQPHRHVLITHGTDTMVETARVVAAAVHDKTVVLTGAMVPYAFGSSDGLFNLGSALSFAQVLPPGVYIAMNGQHFAWNEVRKNREHGVFERSLA